MQYPTADAAYNRFAQLLRKNGFAILRSIPKHKLRHRLIETPNIDFYCLYRKNEVKYGTFERFNQFFAEFVRDHPIYKGHAESINEEVLNNICKEKYNPLSDDYTKVLILVYIYRDTKIYFTHPFTFKKFAQKYNLFRSHNAVDFKKEIGGKTNTIHEVTYHLPFHESFFRNFNDWLNKEATKFIFS